MLRMNRLILLNKPRAPVKTLQLHISIWEEKLNIYHTHKVRDIRRTTNVNLILNVKKSSPSNYFSFYTI